MFGSLHEAHDVLINRGVVLDPKTVRAISFHYAARARLVQQIDNTTCEDTVTGRRVVMSSDGGRLRLREHKRGPKTKKGRKRYTAALSTWSSLCKKLGSRDMVSVLIGR